MSTPNNSSLVTRVIRQVFRVLRFLVIIAAGAGAGAGWATWSIHGAGHPLPAVILGGVAALAAAKLLYDITRRGSTTS